ncbi:peptidoglycan-binding protein [Streptomyces canus]|uniref:peptidoglycan-binding protein n=1 Tax=Streptomyces canus TaxID=58343 RepID=UPI000376315B|nr:peptidoglycan-binding protein [Streptomyces canus]
MTSTRDQFVNLLKSQAGYHEGRDQNGIWNNIQKFSEQTPGLEWSDGQPWCAVFEAWGAHHNGIDALWPMTASCALAVSWWKKQNRFTEYPVLGGPFYMGPGGADHTGVVWKYDADTIWTIEGNSNDNGSYQGDGVYLHQRPRRGTGSPYGYGVPAYAEGTISADPSLGGTAAAEVPVPQPAYEPFPGGSFFVNGRRSPIIAAMHKRLVAVGCGRYQSDANADVWGSGDERSYAAWQRHLGFAGTDADGIPGKTSWDKLHVPNV